MQNVELYVTERPGLAPEIQCEPLPTFDRTNLESVQRVFQSAVPCLFRQAWLDHEEAGFSPGAVRMGWRENSLLVFAELTDMDIFNGATKLNQRTWELGDVFEIFLRSSKKTSYVEFHVTPQNQRLQLHYPDASAAERVRKQGRLDDVFVRHEVFYSKTWVDARRNRWWVFAEIPAEEVCGSNEPVENTPWRFSFGRYDYTRGASNPVISSTSPHAGPDFHCQHEWGVLSFKNSLVIVN
jgi:hypothetical protein